MLKLIIGFVVVLAGFFGYAYFQPAEYKISRSISIKSSPEALFPFINNSEKMNQWMPWIESDPKVKMTFSGPTDGVGSISSWESEGSMGVGSSEIIESILNKSVKSKITYLKPMVMEQVAEMSVVSNPEGVEVRWSVVGQNNAFGRFVTLFLNMDKMVGSEFEKGLNKLKAMAETMSQPR